LVALSPVFVPETEASNGTVNVFDAVPPAIVNPFATELSVNPFTLVGVIAPSPIVMAGVGDAIDQVAVTPLFAVAVETLVTVPDVDEVPAPIAVRKSDAERALTVLSALNWGNVIADGLVNVNILLPRVVAPNDVLPVAAVSPVAPPSHFKRSVYAVFQFADASDIELPQAAPVETAIPTAG
jgi:hypothetical protein